MWNVWINPIIIQLNSKKKKHKKNQTQRLNTLSPAFATLEGQQSFLMKVVYLFGNVVLLVMALYKCHYMGLLPLSPSDWIEFAEHKEVHYKTLN